MNSKTYAASEVQYKDRPSTRLDNILGDLQDLNDRAANLCASKSEHNERVLGSYPAVKGDVGLEPAAPPAGVLGRVEQLIKSIRSHLVALRDYEDFSESSL